MKTLLLDQFGEASLRRLARQVGLPGAESLSRDLLIVGLRAILAERPAPADEDESPDDGEGDGEPSAIPATLATETMARLLEQQGKVDAAARIRRRRAPGPAPLEEPAPEDGQDPGHVSLVLGSRKLATVRYQVTEVGRRWAERLLDGPGPHDWVLARCRVSPGGDLDEEMIVLSSPAGELPWRLPPDTWGVAAAVGLRSATGTFVAVAHTAPIPLPGAAEGAAEPDPA
jgi:hypothetical protein